MYLYGSIGIFLTCILLAVPCQNNTWDCGVFVSRYAYAIYELRNRSFTYGDAGLVGSGRNQGRRGIFKDLISDSAEFNFNMDDIGRFRLEFRTLVERLSTVYSKFKKQEAEKKRVEKEKAKALRNHKASIEHPSQETSDGEVEELGMPPKNEDIPVGSETTNMHYEGTTSIQETMGQPMDDEENLNSTDELLAGIDDLSIEAQSIEI